MSRGHAERPGLPWIFPGGHASSSFPPWKNSPSIKRLCADPRGAAAGSHPGQGRAGAAPGAQTIPQGDASPRQPGRNVCCHRSLRRGNIFHGKEKKKKKSLPVYSSVAVLFCRRRDTEPEEERRQRWESFKKLWLKLFHPLEKGLGSCKTAGGCFWGRGWISFASQEERFGMSRDNLAFSKLAM